MANRPAAAAAPTDTLAKIADLLKSNNQLIIDGVGAEVTRMSKSMSDAAALSVASEIENSNIKLEEIMARLAAIEALTSKPKKEAAARATKEPTDAADATAGGAAPVAKKQINRCNFHQMQYAACPEYRVAADGKIPADDLAKIKADPAVTSKPKEDQKLKTIAKGMWTQFGKEPGFLTFIEAEMAKFNAALEAPK